MKRREQQQRDGPRLTNDYGTTIQIALRRYACASSILGTIQYLEGSGVRRGGGHDDAVSHGILLGQETHQLGDRRPLLADAHIPGKKTKHIHIHTPTPTPTHGTHTHHTAEG